MGTHNVVNVWREMQPDEFVFFVEETLSPTNFFQIALFSDFRSPFAMSPSTDDHVLPGFQFDHSIPTLNLQFCESVHGKGCWKLNAPLFEDKEYVAQMHDALKIEMAQEYKDQRTKWERKNDV